MSRGPGFIERKIVNLLRYGRREPLDARDIADKVYQSESEHWAQHNAVLRAMRSVARKHPDRFVLRGGKGRAPLRIMPAKAAPEWDEQHRPRRRHRVEPDENDELRAVIDEQHRQHLEHHAKWVAYAEKVEPALKEAVARIRELEAELARERKRRRSPKR